MAAINLLLLLFSSSCKAFISPLINRPSNKCTTNNDTYLTAKKNDVSETTINRRDVLQQASIIAATSILKPSISNASDDDLAYLG